MRCQCPHFFSSQSFVAVRIASGEMRLHVFRNLVDAESAVAVFVQRQQSLGKRLISAPAASPASWWLSGRGRSDEHQQECR